ncbi:MAG: hypothetical protein LUQ25_00440 [Methanoregulaceae archaeon]|nr:hypothetical protein [Methanoregulaceae archaeon]
MRTRLILSACIICILSLSVQAVVAETPLLISVTLNGKEFSQGDVLVISVLAQSRTPLNCFEGRINGPSGPVELGAEEAFVAVSDDTWSFSRRVLLSEEFPPGSYTVSRIRVGFISEGGEQAVKQSSGGRIQVSERNHLYSAYWPVLAFELSGRGADTGVTGPLPQETQVPAPQAPGVPGITAALPDQTEMPEPDLPGPVHSVYLTPTPTPTPTATPSPEVTKEQKPWNDPTLLLLLLTGGLPGGASPPGSDKNSPEATPGQTVTPAGQATDVPETTPVATPVRTEPSRRPPVATPTVSPETRPAPLPSPTQTAPGPVRGQPGADTTTVPISITPLPTTLPERHDTVTPLPLTPTAIPEQTGQSRRPPEVTPTAAVPAIPSPSLPTPTPVATRTEPVRHRPATDTTTAPPSGPTPLPTTRPVYYDTPIPVPTTLTTTRPVYYDTTIPVPTPLPTTRPVYYDTTIPVPTPLPTTRPVYYDTPIPVPTPLPTTPAQVKTEDLVPVPVTTPVREPSVPIPPTPVRTTLPATLPTSPVKVIPTTHQLPGPTTIPPTPVPDTTADSSPFPWPTYDTGEAPSPALPPFTPGILEELNTTEIAPPPGPSGTGVTPDTTRRAPPRDNQTIGNITNMTVKDWRTFLNVTPVPVPTLDRSTALPDIVNGSMQVGEGGEGQGQVGQTGLPSRFLGLIQNASRMLDTTFGGRHQLT